MSLIKEASTCHKCGAETSLKFGASREDIFKDVYTVFCLSCHTNYRSSECAIQALQNARARIEEDSQHNALPRMSTGAVG